MKKQEFTDKIAVLEQFISEQRKVAEFVNSTLFKDSVPSVCSYGDELMKLAISQLEELSNSIDGNIEWYLFERSETANKMWHGQGIEKREFVIKDAGDLWEFENYVRNYPYIG